MSQFSYEQNRKQLESEFEIKKFELKGIRHYDRLDMEMEKDKRWMLSLVTFFIGLIVGYILTK